MWIKPNVAKDRDWSSKNSLIELNEQLVHPITKQKRENKRLCLLVHSTV